MNRSGGEFSSTRWPACICARETRKKFLQIYRMSPSHHGRAHTPLPMIVVPENSLKVCCAGCWAWAASVSLPGSPDGAHGAPTCLSRARVPKWKAPSPRRASHGGGPEERKKRFPEKETGRRGDGRRSFAVSSTILSTARLSASAPAWSWGTLALHDAAQPHTAHG
jgi:hypothetical protein